MRSVGAAMRAAERDAQRRHKQALKLQAIEDATDAVDEWEQYIDELISIHTNVSDDMDWQTIASAPKPIEPVLKNTHEKQAVTALANFKPGIFDFLQGGSAKKKQRLEENVEEAPAKDSAEYRKQVKAYQKSLAEWENETAFAKRLISGDIEAIKEAIEELQTLTSESLIGSAVSFKITDEYVHAIPEVHGEDIVPNYRRKQLASGKLSETKMPAGQFNELYQDYVASVALKVAGDLFQILPVSEVYVTCVTDMLSPATGYKEKTPILSAQFVRETLYSLNLMKIDPSDSLANFNHVMDFKKTKGLYGVSPLKPLD